MLAEHWDALEGVAGAAYMPARSRTGRLATGTDLGEGSYGVALATSAPAIVLKLTTDPTEARFAAIALQAPQHPGVVRYLAAATLPTKLRGKTVYALWREAVAVTGVAALADLSPTVFGDVVNVLGALKMLMREPTRYLAKGPGTPRARLLALRAARTGAGARAARVDTPMNSYDAMRALEAAADPTAPAAAAGWALATFPRVADRLAGLPAMGLIGAALRSYAHEGIFLGDVHPGNVGTTPRGLVVFDPGQAILLEPKWARLFPPAPGSVATRGGSSTL